MIRNKEIKVRLTQEEYDSLTEKAKASGLSREKFCRLLFKDIQIKAAPTADIPLLIKELRKIGTNINSIAARAHSYKYVDAPLLEHEIRSLQNIENLIISTFMQGK